MVFNREKEKNGIKTMLDNVYQTESGQQKNVGFFLSRYNVPGTLYNIQLYIVHMQQVYLLLLHCVCV